MTIAEDRMQDVLRLCDELLDLDGPAQPDTALLDQGIDSMEVVKLLAALESEFSVVIPLELMSLKALRSPNDLWQLVQATEGRDGGDHS
ncbi:MAG TPA: acyl carrier protein [Actinoplanes sp.]|nr:acyl carrier protein [Actinoplanes sp.]